MRRTWLLISLALLIGALITLQRYRFEKVPEIPVITLADLNAAKPILTEGARWEDDQETRFLFFDAGTRASDQAIRFDLSPIEIAEALHITFELQADSLVCGQKNWEDGRLLVNWDGSGGISTNETDPVGSVRDEEHIHETSVVVRPTSEPSRPTLHVENLGPSGTLSLSQIEITSVRERALWKAGRWVLLAGWLSWLYIALESPTQHSAPRRAMSSAIWVGMAVLFVFPGPWENLRPLITNFDLGESTGSSEGIEVLARAANQQLPIGQATPANEPTESLGQIEPKEGLILTAKRLLKSQRNLLHVLLFFLPTFAFAGLLGWRAALILSGLLSLGMEAAQLGFGYGFDLQDMGDLACDFTGILMALWGWKTRAKKLDHRTSTLEAR